MNGAIYFWIPSVHGDKGVYFSHWLLKSAQQSHYNYISTATTTQWDKFRKKNFSTCTKEVQFYCPSPHTYAAISYCTIFPILRALWKRCIREFVKFLYRCWCFSDSNIWMIYDLFICEIKDNCCQDYNLLQNCAKHNAGIYLVSKSEHHDDRSI